MRQRAEVYFCEWELGFKEFDGAKRDLTASCSHSGSEQQEEGAVEQLWGLFKSLDVIGQVGGCAADESIFFSPQSHTPEVKHDQITPPRCCVGLLSASHRGNP